MSESRGRRGTRILNDTARRVGKSAGEAFESGWDEVACSIEPLTNITVGVEEITVTVDLPLVDQDQIRIQVHGEDTVEIYAKTKRTVRFEDLGIKHRRGEFTCYHVVMNLPESVDGARAIHQMKCGVLEIRLPKLR